jgi:DNA-binding SARP family transcriptional activator/LysM repeat protein
MNPKGSAHRIIKGLSSCAGLVLLMVGVPAVLAALAGWPLPRTMPDPERIKAVLSSRAELPSTVVIKAVAVVGWIAWLEISLAIFVEASARVRHGTVMRLRLPGGGGAQTLAAHLVAGAVLLAGTRVAVPSAPPLTTLVAVSSPAPVAVVPTALQPETATRTEYTVRPGDWLSTIARDELGDVGRYPEIARLNMGRPQADGRALKDPDLIRPGWKLRLPDNGQPVVPRPAAVAPTSEPAVRQSAQASCADATTALPAPDTEPSPESRLEANNPPLAPIDPPPADPVPHESGPPPAGIPETGPGTATGPSAQGRDIAPLNALPIVIPAVLAGLAVSRLGKLRANQQRHRSRGRTITRPGEQQAGLETRIRAIANPEAPAWVDAVTRRLWSALESTSDIPAVVAVRAGSIGVELLLDRVSPVPPPGFVAADGGRTWRLDHHGDLDSLISTVGGQSSALPGLLYVGETPEGPLWLNVEHVGTLSIEGDPEHVEGFFAAAATQLATAPWSDALDVLLSSGDQRLEAFEHVRVSDGTEVVNEASRPIAGAVGLDSRLAARVAPPGLEALAPIVVLAAPGNLETSQVGRLASVARPESGVVLIAAGPVPDATWRLELDGDGGAVLQPLALQLTFAIDQGTNSAVVELMAEAVLSEETTLPASDVETPDAADLEPVDAPIRVRILGPIEIDWPGRAPRTKAAEIVAYLATRDHPVQGDRLRVDLWPAPATGEVADATFRTNISRARSALGLDDEGRPHLREAEQGIYRLGPGITTDWDRFRHLTALARKACSDEAIEHYREAMNLIRGAPFADTPKGSYHWIHGDGLLWEIETAIAETAEQFAELALDAGESKLADWAARQALKVTPQREPLYQFRMRAAHQAGDRDSIERIYRELRLALRALGELEEPTPETVALYESLVGRTQPTAIARAG